MIDLCLHTANIVYLASFLGRDILHLRVLTCVGLVLGIVFFSCQPTPLYGPTIWHVVFLAINAVQILRLVHERRRRSLSEEQELLGEAMFHDLSRGELLTLLTHAMYETPRLLRDIDRIRTLPLNPDELVLRDVAFGSLSREEILNLLTRRLWNSVARRRPARRGGSRRQVPMTPIPRPETDVARPQPSG